MSKEIDEHAATEAAKRAAATRKARKKKEFVRPPDEAGYPHPPAETILDIAARRAYAGEPVRGVYIDVTGRLRATDAANRPLWGYLILNIENGKTRVFWRLDPDLPKRGAYLADETYEALRSAKYVVLVRVAAH